MKGRVYIFYAVFYIFIDSTIGDCPNSDDIIPCICSEVLGYGDPPDMDCSAAENEEDIFNVFNTAVIPTKEMGTFTIKDNTKITHLSYNLFDTVTFMQLHLETSLINSINDSFFDNFHLSMFRIDVIACTKMKNRFPFDVFTNMAALTTLEFPSNEQSIFPTITSDYLITMYLTDNLLPNVPVDSLKGMGFIEVVYLTGNLIPTIEPYTFSGFNHMRSIVLTDNYIGDLPSYAFDIVHDTKTQHVYLNGNQISHFENNTFVGWSHDFIYLNDNLFTTLDEASFSPLLSDKNWVIVYGNPIVCDCNIAWVLNNSTLFPYINNDNPTCDDGTLLSNVDLSGC